MAVRKNKMHSNVVRERIKVTQLLNFLTKYALGEWPGEIDPARVTAALGVLKKALPDLHAVEHSGDVEVHTVSAEPLTEQQWAETYGGDRPTAH